MAHFSALKSVNQLVIIMFVFKHFSRSNLQHLISTAKLPHKRAYSSRGVFVLFLFLFCFRSKTIERVVAIRFNEHADAYRLMPLRQSAYRAFHSTETAVTDVHNRLIRCVDRGGNVSVLVLLDLSSAFDTVDHAILLEVLEKRFGIAGGVLSWYCSYLTERTQTYKVRSQISGTFVVYYSVPQGSVLGALKFIVYTEDLPAVVGQYEIEHHLYADDTQLSDDTPVTCVTTSIRNMENCVGAVHAWCLSKRLRLNPKKTEVIWFGTRATLDAKQLQISVSMSVQPRSYQSKLSVTSGSCSTASSLSINISAKSLVCSFITFGA